MLKGAHLRSFFRRIVPVLLMCAVAWVAPAAGQTTYRWAGGATGSWASATNWTPVRTTPAANDIIVLDTGSTLTLTNVPTQTLGQLLVQPNGVTPTIVHLQAASANRVLTVAGSVGADLVVATGSGLNLTGANALQILVGAGATGTVFGNMILSGGIQTLNAVDMSGLSFESGSSLQQNCPGNVFTAAGTANAVHFKSGSTFTRLMGGSPFGLAQPSSKVIFAPGSLYSHQQPIAPDMSGRSYGDFEYRVGSSQSATGSAPLSMGSLAVEIGSLSLGMTGAFSIKGDIKVNAGGSLNFNAATNSTIQLNGTSPQTLNVVPGGLMLSSQETLQLNNPAGLLLVSDLYLTTGTLSLLSGNVTTGSNLLDFSPGGTLSAGISGWVVGNLVLRTPSSGALLYPIGSPTAYLPVTFNFGGASGGISLKVSTTGSDHPALGSSNIDPTRSVNRYWSVTQMSGGTFTNPVSITFIYPGAEVDPGSNFGRYRVARLAGSWTTQTPSSGTGTDATVSGLTTLAGDYAVGEGAVTYTWVGGSSGSWGSSANWSPARTDLATNDILRFAGGGAIAVGSMPNETIGQLLVTGGAIVTLTMGATPRTLTLSGWLGTDLDVAGGSALDLAGNTGAALLRLQSGATGTIAGSMTFSGGAAHAMDIADTGAVSFDSGSNFTQTSPGNAFGSSGSPNAVIFRSGSSLVPAGNGQSPFGLPAPASKITLEPGSLYRHTLASGLDFAGRTFGNFEYNGPTPASVAGVSGTGNALIHTLAIAQGEFRLVIDGVCTVLGNIIVSPGAGLALNGPAPESVTLTLGGTATQQLLINGALSGNGFATLKLNNAAGAYLPSTLTLSGCELNFQSGILSTGVAPLTLTSSAQVTGASAVTGWVNGSLRRAVVPDSGEASQRFDVGDSARFTPVDLVVHGLAAAFDVTARTSTPDHPSIAGASVDVTHTVNRWWTLTPATTPTITSADVTLHFDPLDLDAGTNTAYLAVRRFAGATWSVAGSGANSSTSAQGIGVTGFGDFVAGQSRFIITASAGVGGTIAPAGAVSVLSGDSQVFTITPDTSFRVADLLVDGISVGPMTSYTFATVTADHTIDAFFLPDCWGTTPQFLSQWGVLGSGDSQFNLPSSLTVGPGDHAYVADYGNDRIQKFTSTGAFEAKWGVEGAGNGQFRGPYGIHTDALGQVFVSDPGNQRVQKFTANGNYLGKWGSPGIGDGMFDNPVGLDVDATGQVYVSEQYNHRVQVFDNNGTFVRKFGTHGSGPGQMGYPYHTAIGTGGRIFVAEIENARIQVFDAAGQSLYSWGSAGTADGQFGIDGPRGMAVDAKGLVYVADSGNDRIQVFTPEGAFVTAWGTSGSGPGQFNHPQGIAFDSAGRIYVVDTLNHRVQQFAWTAQITASAGPNGTISPAGVIDVPCEGIATFTMTPAPGYRLDRLVVDGVDVGSPLSYTFTQVRSNHTIFALFTRDCVGTAPGFVARWGSFGTGDGQFNTPTSLAVDGAGHVYVADYNNARIQKFDSNGVFQVKWGTPGFGDGQFIRAYGVVADSLGNVFVSDPNWPRIQKFTAAGSYLAQWGSVGSGNGEFDNPVGLGVGASGEVYVSEQYNSRVQVFDNNGSYLRQFGSFGSGPGQMRDPYHTAIGANGYVYVAEIGNARIQVFDAAGLPLFSWGSAGSGDGQFGNDGPRSVAVDSHGQVYVADSGNDRIQVFSAAGSYLTQWGGPGSGEGQFNHPESVAIDGNGFIYVADTGNHRIQKFACFGAVSATREPEPPSSLLLSASPNPSFAPRLTLGLPHEADIELAIFDVAGRRVRRLDSARLGAGQHAISWDGRDDRGEAAPAGMYYVRLTAGRERRSISMLLLR